MRPLKAIRAKCVDCAGGHRSAVRDCSATDCPLHCYRFGHNPRRQGIGGRRARPPALTNPNSRASLARVGTRTAAGSSGGIAAASKRGEEV